MALRVGKPRLQLDKSRNYTFKSLQMIHCVHGDTFWRSSRIALRIVTDFVATL
jgi:hypothetical protein